MDDRTCVIPECDTTFPAVPYKKYCSPRCKKIAALAVKRAKNRQAMPPHCLQCSGPIPTDLRANALYCGTKCGDEADAKAAAERRRRRPTVSTTMQCTRCDSTIEWKPRRKYCPPCSDDALREGRYRHRVAYKHKLRALAVDSFEPREIHERDHWTCSLCREPIDKTLKHPEPMSASIDHIIPVSLGGAHSSTNVASAHLVCNLRKGNRTPETAQAL